MKTLKESFKKKSRRDQYVGYYLTEERRDNANTMFPDLYSLANSYEENRVYSFEALTADQKLDSIVNEVKVRVRITKQEIFRIGELLFMAKKICHGRNENFQDWIEKNFDFSYETAINFMHVYRYCFSYRQLAVEVPTSILYKVSMPSFPDDLRDFLFKEGQLEKLSNGKLQTLVRLYNEEGMDAVEKKMEGLHKWSRIYHQIKYNLDLYENALRILTDYKLKLENGGLQYTSGKHSDYKDFVLGNETEAQEINLTLHKALVNSIEGLKKAFDECQNRASEILKNLNNQM